VGVPPPQLKCIRANNTLITAPFEISNIFATTWSKYSEDCNFNIQYRQQKAVSLEYVHAPGRLSLSAKQLEYDFTELELETALTKAKGKTPGHDRISYPMLKQLPATGKAELLNLYNNIFSVGQYPHVWKSAIIVPIPKPNKPSDEVASYRPISLLPCIAKTFEEMIARRLLWYATKNKLISTNQGGFKPKHSTMDSLLHLQHFVSDALSSRNHVTFLATDFEKAFDRVGAHTVLQQLEQWGVGTKVFNIVKAFMSHRSFRVRINNVLSNYHNLYTGIPQGSPLSVILFIIAFEEINKIVSNHKKIQLIMYADDAIIFSKIKDLTKLQLGSGLWCNPISQ